MMFEFDLLRIKHSNKKSLCFIVLKLELFLQSSLMNILSSKYHGIGYFYSSSE